MIHNNIFYLLLLVQTKLTNYMRWNIQKQNTCARIEKLFSFPCFLNLKFLSLQSTNCCFSLGKSSSLIKIIATRIVLFLDYARVVCTNRLFCCYCCCTHLFNESIKNVIYKCKYILVYVHIVCVYSNFECRYTVAFF